MPSGPSGTCCVELVQLEASLNFSALPAEAFESVTLMAGELTVLFSASKEALNPAAKLL
jgi:hypothetical protein